MLVSVLLYSVREKILRIIISEFLISSDFFGEPSRVLLWLEYLSDHEFLSGVEDPRRSTDRVSNENSHVSNVTEVPDRPESLLHQIEIGKIACIT
jgi:hypothetical protein